MWVSRFKDVEYQLNEWGGEILIIIQKWEATVKGEKEYEEKKDLFEGG